LGPDPGEYGTLACSFVFPRQMREAIGRCSRQFLLRPAIFKADKASKKLRDNRKKPLDKRTPLG
jgi:hypothetical protein